MKCLFFILLCPPWTQWLSPLLPWHSLGHRNPLFFRYHSVTQKLLQSCAVSEDWLPHHLPWNCPNSRALSPSSSTLHHLCSPPFPKQSLPFPNPRESSSSPRENSPQNSFYQILSVSQIFWVLSRAEILETKATASSFSLIPCHMPHFGQ